MLYLQDVRIFFQDIIRSIRLSVKKLYFGSMTAPIFSVDLHTLRELNGSSKKRMRVLSSRESSSIQNSIATLMLKSPIGSRSIRHETSAYSYKPPTPLRKGVSKGYDYLIEETRVEPIEVLKHQKKLITFANINLPMHGHLIDSQDGGYDLLLSDDFLRYFHFGGKLEQKALIRVIFPGEALKVPATLGAKFNFSIKGFYSMEPYSMPGICRVFFIGIESQALKDYRAFLGLTDLYNGHDFLILLSQEEGRSMKPMSYLRVNHACLYA